MRIVWKIGTQSFFLTLLLLLAFFIRSKDFATNIQFDSDFGRDSVVAYRILHGDLTLLGPYISIGGLYLGPLYFYAVAFIYGVFGYTPEVLSWIFLSIGVLTCILCMLLARKEGGWHAGWIALLLTVCNPMLIATSQTATAQPLMPITTAFFFLVLMRAIATQRYRWMLATGLALGLFFHVHLSVLLILPGIVVALPFCIRGSYTHKLISLLLIASGVVVMLSPLILFDLTHGGLLRTAFLRYIQTSISGQTTGLAYPHLSVAQKLSMVSTLFPTGYQIGSILLILGGIGALIKARTSTLVWVLLACICSSLVLILLYQGYIFPYYFYIPFTCLLLLLALGLSALRPRGLGILLALAIGILGIQGHATNPKFRTVSNLDQIVAVITKDIDVTTPSSFTVFKDSSDQMTGIGYEYRFLLMRRGYQPVHEHHYDQAAVLYYIQEEGTNNPLISYHHETTQFGATKAQIVDIVPFADRQVPIYRLTR